MDWYFESDIEDLAMPKYEELLDRCPSPESWSPWDNMIGNHNSPKKVNAVGVEELLLSETMFFSAVEQLSPPSVCQGSRHIFRQHSACPHEYSDVQLDDLPLIAEADDIFFNSLFGINASALEEAECSSNSTQTSSKDDAMAVVGPLGGRTHIRHSINNAENVGHFLQEKEPEAENCILLKQSNVCEDVSQQVVSMEESALLELQNLSVQLAKKTRICFRDALYRLAENSRYQSKYGRNGEEDLEKGEVITRFGPSRLPESKAKKSDTNAIDRTVATLLFNTMKFHNPTAPSKSGLDAETLHREYQDDSHFYHPSSSVSSLCAVPGGDAEVPTFGPTNQPLLPPRRRAPFSTTYDTVLSKKKIGRAMV